MTDTDELRERIDQIDEQAPASCGNNAPATAKRVADVREQYLTGKIDEIAFEEQVGEILASDPYADLETDEGGYEFGPVVRVIGSILVLGVVILVSMEVARPFIQMAKQENAPMVEAAIALATPLIVLSVMCILWMSTASMKRGKGR